MSSNNNETILKENDSRLSNLRKLRESPHLKLISKKDLELNFKFIKLCSIMGLIPIDIRVKSGHMSWQQSRLRLGLHFMYMTIWVLHWALGTFRLAEYFVFKYDSKDIDQLPCPVLCTLTSSVCLYLNYHFFWSSHRTLFLALGNALLDLLKDGEKRQNLATYNRSESLAVFLSNFILGSPAIHLGLFLISSEGYNFIYYNLPDFLKTFWTSYVVCAVVEFIVVLTWMATAVVILLMELICFLNMDAYLKCSAVVMRYDKQGHPSYIGQLRKAHEVLRELQIFMQSFNEI
ncbi:unnamed protein product [Allacma fusca]|uniref:Uncharacterized protein n=1 Tax=Allacma fusca TaxID=39272 RepID=A0A8J2JL82_9HEXA|nr:unnamed protein product [Allacma fusca]